MKPATASAGISLEALAQLVNGEVRGDRAKTVSGAAPFEAATPEDVTFAGSGKFLRRLGETRAGAVLVPRDCQHSGCNLIAVDNPQTAFVKMLHHFLPSPKVAGGISSRACMADNVVCGDGVAIGPCAVVQQGAAIGSRTVIHPGVVIGCRVTVGEDCCIHPNVTICDDCRIGNRVTIHAGTVIGSDGFGFAPEGETYLKIPHRGIVQIDDDVEIGAGNTIDRATYGKTWLQKGVKTDNLVHVAHNVTVGENTLLVAQVGVSGSVTIGRHAILAGQAGVAQHLTIGDNAIVGPKAGIGSDVPAGTVVSGAPEMPHRQWLRVQRTIPRLPDLKKKIDEIEKKLQAMEQHCGQLEK